MNWLEMIVFGSTKGGGGRDDLEMILKWMHNLIYSFAYRKSPSEIDRGFAS